jgi:demethylmenaquinone methyltransferase/2-methoxy-6-polyprenyl-1,4-benzoquinol methylase
MEIILEDIKNKSQEEIVTMFNQIAKTYDLANRILSVGVDKTWRKKACNKAFFLYDKQKIDKIVDVACGTGDLMIDWKKNAQVNQIVIDQIVGVDPSVGMMEVGKTKIEDGVFIEAGAEDMPLESSSADIISISYGIRNVLKRKEAWSEFTRILKPNGLAVILEFTKNTDNNFAHKMTNFYMHNMMPFIGGAISGSRDAYTYLPESIENFITTEQMCMELKEAGLEPIFIQPYSMKMSTTIIARKIA